MALSAPLLVSAAPVSDTAVSETAAPAAQTEAAPGIDRAQLSAKETRTLNRFLNAREMGESQQCISRRLILRTVAVTDEILVYEMVNGDVFVNKPRTDCPNAKGNAISTIRPSDRICSGDIGTITDFRTGVTMGGCSLGEFVEYEKVDNASAD